MSAAGGLPANSQKSRVRCAWSAYPQAKARSLCLAASSRRDNPTARSKRATRAKSFGRHGKFPPEPHAQMLAAASKLVSERVRPDAA
jgi:hypothetical protein